MAQSTTSLPAYYQYGGPLTCYPTDRVLVLAAWDTLTPHAGEELEEFAARMYQMQMDIYAASGSMSSNEVRNFWSLSQSARTSWAAQARKHVRAKSNWRIQ